MDAKKGTSLMKVSRNFWPTFAAPFLILIAILGLFQRSGNDRVQSLPSLVLGIGLICNGVLERQHHRKTILRELRKNSSK
ncbi:Hypothetical protein P9211_17371 [Prochlorococcus marinus str. MIT 9211]|uniref:DUF3188 domain-containing protein n=1 Tax=Prochlorococcus marinus (strain MIT 9211) TaxID=93059 RepID=A9BD55_PROM4|nr:Hypothetical protein P9211_17371 [Prochlorococcus marinus str. MIT 9211]